MVPRTAPACETTPLTEYRMLVDTAASPRATFISKLSVAGHAPLTVVAAMVHRPSYLAGTVTGVPAAQGGYFTEMIDQPKHFAGFLEPIAKTAALFGGSLYIAGFIIINSYLSKFGLSDFNVINSRFVFTGASFSIACLIWWLVSGRLYIFKDLLEEWSDDYFPPPNNILSLLAGGALLLARSVTASLMIVFIMFGSGVIALPCLFIVSIMMIMEAFLSRSISPRARHPNFVSAFRLLSSSGVICIFFVMFRGKGDPSSIFYLMMSLEAVGLPLGQAIRDRQLLDFKEINSPIYFTMMIGLYLISFGIQFYDKISLRFGGGLSQNIEIMMKDPIALSGIHSSINNTIKGTLLYSNDKYILLSISGKNLIITPDQIKASIIDAKPDSSNIYRMIKTVRRLGIPWKYKYSNSISTLVTLDLTLSLSRSMFLTCYSDWQYVCGAAMPINKSK